MNITFQRLVLAGLVLAGGAASAHAQSVKVDEQQATGTPQSVLASAKDLYAAASYEAALLELSAFDARAREDADQIDTYRALCQLALNRPQDAEQTLEQIVSRKPTYTINDAQYSPRLVSMFRDVRKRALPAAVQNLYVAGKRDYESNNYAAAVAKFTLLLSVLGDPDIADRAGTTTDLRELADGFLKLSQLKLAEAAPLKAAVPAPAAAAASVPSSTGAVAPASYSSRDVGIKPPVVISQVMPAWRPSQSQAVNTRTFIGRLEIVIDEQGTVESMTLLKSIWPTYDPLLLQAAKNWHYQPALKNGQPVKFAKVLEITVK
jgi:Gram-negative bacterial TonB protein C-terminal